jgi:hypothetical protein
MKLSQFLLLLGWVLLAPNLSELYRAIVSLILFVTSLILMIGEIGGQP